MKIQLDTENKTIKLENDILLSKLIATLDSLLPNKEWKKYTLETNTTINHWHSPVVIEKFYPRPYEYPWFTHGTYVSKLDNSLSMKSMSVNADNKYQLKSGVFNVELKA